MRPVSARYLEAVRSSHEIVSRVRLVTPGQEGVTPMGTVLALVDGSVTLDASAPVRTSADLVLAEPWSDDGAGIAPYGQELYVERGVVYGNGLREFVGLGYLRITDVDQSDAPLGALRVSLQDRMSALVEAKLLQPVQYTAVTTYGAVVTALVQEVLPAQTIEWDDATDAEAVGRALIVEEDRQAFLQDLITSVGKVWYFDHRGILVIKDAPDSTAVVYEVDAGEGGVLVTASRSLSREGVYNAVKASGEGVDNAAPVYAIAYDDNPLSLTYWDGPYGHVPYFHTSASITSTAQAMRAATGILAGLLGLPYDVDFTMVPNVALEPLDPVRVSFPPDLSKDPKVRREVHVLDTIAIPLTGAGAMRATTRLSTLLEVAS